MRASWAGIIGMGLAVSACAPKTFTRPSGAGESAPEAAEIWSAATAECRKVQSDAPTLDVVGARISVRGLITARNEIRLEADYHGQSVFTLAGTDARAVLLLMGESGYEVVQAPAGDIVEVLVGLRVDPASLLSVITGCVTSDASIVRAVRHEKLLAVHTASAVAYLAQKNAIWRVAGADLARFRVDYPAYAGAWPREVVIAPPQARAVKLRIHSHLIDPAPIPGQFDLTPPAGSRRITLEELKARWKEE